VLLFGIALTHFCRSACRFLSYERIESGADTVMGEACFRSARVVVASCPIPDISPSSGIPACDRRPRPVSRGKPAIGTERSGDRKEHTGRAGGANGYFFQKSFEPLHSGTRLICNVDRTQRATLPWHGSYRYIAVRRTIAGRARDPYLPRLAKTLHRPISPVAVHT
jgi:hypothetical protein